MVRCSSRTTYAVVALPARAAGDIGRFVTTRTPAATVRTLSTKTLQPARSGDEPWGLVILHIASNYDVAGIELLASRGGP